MKTSENELNIYGVRIVASPLVKPQPKIQISPHFTDCTEAMRAKVNAYLLEEFGTYDPVYAFDPRGISIGLMGGAFTYVTSPTNLARLKGDPESVLDILCAL